MTFTITWFQNWGLSIIHLGVWITVMWLFFATCYSNRGISLGLKIHWASKSKIRENVIVDSKNENGCANYVLFGILMKELNVREIHSKQIRMHLCKEGHCEIRLSASWEDCSL